MSNLPSHLGGHKSRTHIDVGVLKFARDKLKVKSMLDIGCGTGFVGLTISKNTKIRFKCNGS